MEKVRILVVEDEEIVAADIRSTLRKLGYLVVASASSGEEAVSLTATHQPDLVLMDMVLKGAMDGVEAAEEIHVHYNIPVIYLTAYSDDATLRRAKITEPYGYILKPFEDRELSTAIELALYKSQMDRKVRNLEEWLAITLRSIGEGIVATDLKGNITYLNPLAEVLSGWKQAEAEGKPVEEILRLRNDAAEFPVQEWIKEVIEKGESGKELQLVARENKETEVDVNAAPLKDEKGRISGVVMVFRDITERKILQAEQRRNSAAIEEMQQFLQTTLDVMPSQIVVLASDGTILKVNEAWKRFGLENNAPPNTDDIGGNYLKTCDKATGLFSDDAAEAASGIRAVINGQQAGFYQEYACHSPTENRWFIMRVTPFNEPAPRRVVLGHTNITQRKEAEIALQKANDELEQRVQERTIELERVKTRLEVIFNNSGDGILLIDLDQGIQQTNYAFDKLFNSTQEKVIGLPLSTLIHPANTDMLQTAVNMVVLTHKAQQIEVLAQLQDGTGFEAEISISPVNFSENAITSLVCIIRDVSERKRVQQMVAEERNLLRTLIDAVPDYIYVKDIQHRYMINNTAHARSLATQMPLELVGKNDLDIFPIEMAAKFKADEMRLFRSGQPILNIEERSIGQDGGTIWGLTTKAPLRNLKGEVIGLVGITHDITKIKEQEEALQTKIVEEQQFQAYLKILHEVTLELNLVHNLDEFYHRAVELGLERLKFERLGLLLYNPETNKVSGTYGTDAQGKLVAEHQIELDPGDLTAIMKRLLENHNRFEFDPNAQLFSNLQPVGYGWNAAALLWSGEQSLGLLTADNAIEHKLASKALLDIFALYALTIGTLLGQKQVEEALQRSQADLRSIIESSDLAFILLDLKGIIRVFNRAAQEYQQARNELTLIPGHSILEYIAPEGHSIFLERLEQVKNGETLDFVNTVQTEDKPIYFEFKYYPVKTVEGETVGVNITYENITRRKETEHQLNFNASLQKVVSAAVISTDMNSKIQSWNKAAEQIYGWSAEEAVGKRSWEIFKTEFEDGYNLSDYKQEILITGSWQREVVQSRKDGSKIQILSSINLFKDENGEPLGAVGVNNDISDRKKAEETMKQALQQEKKLNELKTRFISMTSHEFRTPLSIILSYSELLEYYGERWTQERRVSAVRDIQESVRHLTDMLDDILTVGKAESGALEFKPLPHNLINICEEAINKMLHSSQPMPQIHFACTFESVLVMLDEKLIRHILINLLSNAIKYSEAGSPVYFNLSKNEKQIIIEVRDEGIGIPPEDQHHIFETFHRSTNVLNISGTGLGLAIVKKNVELHGGEISFISKLGEGTTFTVLLPLDLSVDGN